MDENFQKHELIKLHHDYRGYFPVCDLLLKPEAESNFMHLQTYEGNTYDVSVTAQGWKVDNDTQIYETFESLMMSLSPAFNMSFNEKLSEKLKFLQNRNCD